MCGITGIAYREAGRVDKDRLKRANDFIIHRGPDDEGYYVDDYVGLAMRRLAIIDLKTGQQPIANAGKTKHVIFNGEIYNFLELREELKAEGYSFKTNSDTEVILALYEKMGPDCVKKLRGMFAIAIWDKSKQRLFLARDRLGKKPLVYTLRSGFLAFASELRSLFVWPGIPKDINPKSIDFYLSLQYIPSPYTIYRGINKLAPGHYLIYEKGKLKITRYWDFPLGKPPITTDVHEAQERIEAKLREAVKLRLISDVPLGAFLSGGIDSSVIVALMSELSNKPVKTFSIGFDHDEYTEVHYARELAKAYGCDHHEFIVTAKMAEVLPKLAWHYGEPYADASALPSYYVSQQTRKSVTVALNGDGGDENFGGYVRYFAMNLARYYDHVPSPLRKLVQLSAEILPEKDAPFSLLWKAKRFLRSTVFTDIPRRHLKMICYFSEEDKKGLYTPGMLRAMGIEEGVVRADAERHLRQAYTRGSKEDFINKMLYVDFVTYLPDCLMTKMDIASMANSLETRSPFLDHEFVELAFQMPGNWKLKGLKGHKWILKQAFANKLPQSIQRRAKMGFGIPLGPWFRNGLKNFWQDQVLSDQAIARGYFEKKTLENIWSQHQTGKRDHGYRLWALLMLELWHKQYVPDFKGF